MSRELAGPVWDQVERNQDQFIGLLADLVSVPSVNPVFDRESPGEVAAQKTLMQHLASWGIAAEFIDSAVVDPAIFPSESLDRDRLTDRPNLVATVGPIDRGTLLLNSHMDVVGVSREERGLWETDPFTATVRDGTLYGRGACDAKGPLATMAAAMSLAASLCELNKGVTFTSVADEEAGGGGTLACLSRGITGEAALVGEPTEMHLCPATRSCRRFAMTVRGRSAHPGEAFRGIDAVGKANVYVDALHSLAVELDRRQPHPLWDHLPAQHVFTLLSLRGGRDDGVMAVPDVCRLEFMIGGTAAETLDDLQEETERLIATVTANDPWLAQHPPQLAWDNMALYGSVTDPNHSFTQLALTAAQDVIGDRTSVDALSAVTDMRHLVRYGGIPTINFGPGRMADAHGPNEGIDIDDYLSAITVLATIILRWCA